MQKKLHLKPYIPKKNTPSPQVRPASTQAGPLPIAESIVGLITERASGHILPTSFGSTEEVEAIGYESLLPSFFRAEIPREQPRICIGGSQCLRPYEASVLNCSALSFGPMSKNFILALNKAAKEAGFFQNTGEAGLSPYHFGVDVDIESPLFDMDAFFRNLTEGRYPQLERAGDVVWQIGTGYFGCRNADGSFDPVQFKLKAGLPNIKMIELKLSQGVEPRKEMPVKQVTAGIAKVLGVTWGRQAKLQDAHSAFDSPVELLLFIDQLRNLSGGKPIGIKIGLSHKRWFMAICKAMRKTGIAPDFITIDGMEAGTAAASHGSLGYTGTPLGEGVLFIHNALVGANLRKDIKIIASGKVLTERDMVAKLARGADLFATARGFLLSVGCDQQRECYLGTCPRGIATQDSELMKQFDTETNSLRAFNYHQLTIHELKELLSIAGVTHPSQIGPFHLQKRVSFSESKTLDELYDFIAPGSLLRIWPWLVPARYRKDWLSADPDLTFQEMLAQQLQSIGR